MRDNNGKFTNLLKEAARLPFRLAAWLTRSLVNALYWLLSRSLPSRRTSGRLVFYQLFLLGWLLAASFWLQANVVRCGYNHQVHGWFMSMQECAHQAEAFFDSSRQPVETPMAPNNVQALKDWDMPITAE
jgi:hypothetical protein